MFDHRIGVCFLKFLSMRQNLLVTLGTTFWKTGNLSCKKFRLVNANTKNGSKGCQKIFIPIIRKLFCNGKKLIAFSGKLGCIGNLTIAPATTQCLLPTNARLDHRARRISTRSRPISHPVRHRSPFFSHRSKLASRRGHQRLSINIPRPGKIYPAIRARRNWLS